jgi:surface antigen
MQRNQIYGFFIVILTIQFVGCTAMLGQSPYRGSSIRVSNFSSNALTNPPVGWTCSANGCSPNANAVSYLPQTQGGINPFATRGYGGQCTAFAWGRAHEVLGTTSLPSRGDAKTWYDANHGLPKGSTPRANSIAVWGGDIVNPHGHVAYVESIEGDTAYISEANVETYRPTNYGGGYDGRIKPVTLTRMAARGAGIGAITGYIYLENAPNPPMISQISPLNPETGNLNQNILVYGSNFQPNLSVLTTFPNGQPGPTLSGAQIVNVTAGSFTMKITFGDTGAGTWKIKVQNPDGATSNIYSFPVRSPNALPPVVGSILPLSPTASSVNQPVTVTGTNFTSGLSVETVFPNGQPGPTLSGLQITDIAPNTFKMWITLGNQGNWTIRVKSADGLRSNSFTFSVLPSLTPGPSVTSIDPNPGTASNNDQDIQVLGSNFQSALTVAVFFPGNIPGPVLSGEQIINQTSTSFTVRIRLATPGQWGIRVINPDGRQSPVIPYTVVLSPTAPAISGMSPNPPTRGDSDQSVIVSGSNFLPNLKVDILFPGGLPGPTLSGSQILNVTPTSFTMRITLAAAGSWAARVTNSNGQQSNLFAFQVVQPTNPVPSINSISPANPLAVAGNQNVTVNGSGFQSGLVVAITFPNGQGATLSGSQIFNVGPTAFTMVVNFSGVSGSYAIRVINPDDRASNLFAFSVQPSLNPSISSTLPVSPVASVGNQNVTVNGSGFAAGLTVTATFPNGTTGTLSGSQILNVTPTSFTMVINFNNVPGAYSIRVNNPGGAQSNAFPFTVQTAVPVINSISPSSPIATVGNQNVTVNGTGFVAGLTVIVTFPNGSTATLSGSQILNVTPTSFTMVINFNNVPGAYSIRVNNPGGAQSNAFPFTVQPQTSPVVTSISPSSPIATVGNQNVTVNGSNFVSGLTVTVTFPNGTTGTLSGSQILNVTPTSFTMVINFNNVPGAYSIRVNNPGGAQSNSFPFTVQAAVPVISSISPSSPPRTPGNQNVTVNGQRFVAGLTVTVTFPNGTTGTLSGSQILNVSSGSFVMVINFNNVPGPYSIRVNNPGGAQSNTFSFNVI